MSAFRIDNVLPHLFVVFKASSFSFLSPLAGARDDDFHCLGESRSSMRSLGSILKRLHVRLMMSDKIFFHFHVSRSLHIYPAKREEKSAFLFKFLGSRPVGVRWVIVIYSRGYNIFFCHFFFGRANLHTILCHMLSKSKLPVCSKNEQ